MTVSLVPSLRSLGHALGLGLVLALAACSSPSLSVDAAPMVEPAPELHVLGRFVGDWNGTSEIVAGDPAMLGDDFAAPADPVGDEVGDEEGEPTFDGHAEARWTLGGMFVRTESWHEGPNGKKVRYVDFRTWDGQARKYRSWFFSELGETGESWMTLDEDGTTFHVTATTNLPGGGTSTGTGTMTFLDADTMEWSWREELPDGAVELRGKNVRE